MAYGIDLIMELEQQNAILRASVSDRLDRIAEGMTDMDDCFISDRVESRGISNNEEKIALIREGGCAWFREYATLDGQLVEAKWCETRFGSSLRVVMPDGSVVWTTATTAKGLAKKGLKAVKCLRPAWFTFRSSARGMLGVYSGSYVLFPSDVNYATGETAGVDPIEMVDDD